jgi:hypothetical protein
MKHKKKSKKSVSIFSQSQKVIVGTVVIVLGVLGGTAFMLQTSSKSMQLASSQDKTDLTIGIRTQPTRNADSTVLAATTDAEYAAKSPQTLKSTPLLSGSRSKVRNSTVAQTLLPTGNSWNVTVGKTIQLLHQATSMQRYLR